MKNKIRQVHVGEMQTVPFRRKLFSDFSLSFVPELISNLIIYSLPIILDAHFIGILRSTPSYSVLGMTNNLIHWIIKIAEGLSVVPLLWQDYITVNLILEQ